jgi:hypothetical protein
MEAAAETIDHAAGIDLGRDVSGTRQPKEAGKKAADAFELRTVAHTDRIVICLTNVPAGDGAGLGADGGQE